MKRCELRLKQHDLLEAAALSAARTYSGGKAEILEAQLKTLERQKRGK